METNKVVVKRNGKRVNFDIKKIMRAVSKANTAANSDMLINDIMDVCNFVYKKCPDVSTIEIIQDLVVRKLMSTKHKDVAMCYQGYRAVKQYERNKLNALLNSMSEIVDQGSSENANKDSSLHNVQRDLIAGEYMRYLSRQRMPENILRNHLNGISYWHDEDFSGVPLSNCTIFNLEDMLANGTRINNAEVETPNSIGVAATVASQIVANIAFQEYGGISIGDFNYTMAKYAEKDFLKILRDMNELMELEMKVVPAEAKEVLSELNKKSTEYRGLKYVIDKVKKEIHNAMQTYEYQTNSISSASQTPFSAIMFNIPRNWIEEEIILSYFKVRMKGLGAKGKTAIFPKLSYVCVPGYNRRGDKYFYITKEAAKCISKCFYPDILHYTKEQFENGQTFARMGCRSRVNHDYMVDGKYVNYGRLNCGVHTLNLVQPAILSMRDSKEESIDLVERYFEYLKDYSHRQEEAIIDRFNFVSQMKAKDAPILFMYGGIARLDAEESLEPLFRSDRASISYGYIGIDDAVRLLTDNKETILTPKGSEIGERIMKFIYDEAVRIKKEQNIPVSVYGSPAESLVHKMFQIDKGQFAEHMPEWLLDRTYYTNSYHYSSELQTDAFSKLEAESKFVKYSNGGNINYSEIGMVRNNPEAILDLIEFGNDIGIEYQAFNVRTDNCYECGYEGEMTYSLEHNTYTCPQCGNTDQSLMSVIRRCCGYLSNYEQRKSLKGRMKEIEKRAVHV